MHRPRKVLAFFATPLALSFGCGGQAQVNLTTRDAAAPDSATTPVVDGAPPDAPELKCIDDFSGGTPSRCCPDPIPPDCTTKPEGYPGFACTPPPRSFCSCQCQGGKWQCGC